MSVKIFDLLRANYDFWKLFNLVSRVFSWLEQLKITIDKIKQQHLKCLTHQISNTHQILICVRDYWKYKIIAQKVTIKLWKIWYQTVPKQSNLVNTIGTSKRKSSREVQSKCTTSAKNFIQKCFLIFTNKGYLMTCYK